MNTWFFGVIIGVSLNVFLCSYAVVTPENLEAVVISSPSQLPHNTSGAMRLWSSQQSVQKIKDEKINIPSTKSAPEKQPAPTNISPAKRRGVFKILFSHMISGVLPIPIAIIIGICSFKCVQKFKINKRIGYRWFYHKYSNMIPNNDHTMSNATVANGNFINYHRGNNPNTSLIVGPAPMKLLYVDYASDWTGWCSFLLMMTLSLKLTQKLDDTIQVNWWKIRPAYDQRRFIERLSTFLCRIVPSTIICCVSALHISVNR